MNSDKQNNTYHSEGVYPSYQGTPPPYSQQFVAGIGKCQKPLHQQTGIVIAPVYQPIWKNKLPTQMTSRLRTFLIISGFIYSLWGILAISLQIAIVVNSFSTYYHGFWTGSFLVFGGIVMMIVACRLYYSLIHLIRIYSINLGFCIIGLIFSIINYATSTRCVSLSSLYCDDGLASDLKVFLLGVFSLALIHTIVNMAFICKEQQRTLSKSDSNVAIY